MKEAKFKNYTSAQRKTITDELTDQRRLIRSELESLLNSHGGLLKQYCESLGMSCSHLYLMSFAQHYGGVSPLLDFSFNLNKSLFFMVEGAEMPIAGADENSLDNFMSLYSSKYDEAKEKEYLRLNRETISGEFTDHNSVYKSAAVLSDTMLTLPVIAQLSLDAFVEGGVMRARAKGDTRTKQKLIEVVFQEIAVPYFDHIFNYDTLCSHEMPEIQPFLIPNKPLWLEINGESRQSRVMVSNLNIVAQEGCFVYYDRDLNPLEYQLRCADIHKSLIPYIKKNYLQDYPREVMYPDPNLIACQSLFNALVDN